MSYKIVAQYYKDISFEIPDAKTALLLEKDIKNYKFICDINSEKVKENIEFCKCNYKALLIGSFAMHFIFDLFIFGLGVLLGMHIGH